MQSQSYIANGTPVNASQPSLYPSSLARTPKRRYEQGYRTPPTNFHMVANDEAAILLPAIGGTAYAILECLRSHLNNRTGQCNPSINTISREIGVVPATVKSNLIYLYETNVVQRIKRCALHRTSGEPRVEMLSNQYIFPAASEWTLDKVSRKRAKKAIVKNKKQPTLVEIWKVGETEVAFEVGQGLATNKKKGNKKNLTTQIEQNACSEKIKINGRTYEVVPVVVSEILPDFSDLPPQAEATHEIASTCSQPQVAGQVAEDLLAQVIGVGVREREARRLLVDVKAEVICQQLIYLPDRNAHSPAAMLIRSCCGNWSAPEKSQQRLKEEKASKKESERIQAVAQATQQRREKVQQQDQEQKDQGVENALLDEQWGALDEDTLKLLEPHVMGHTNALSPLRGRPGPGLSATRRNVLRQYLAGTLSGAAENLSHRKTRL